MTIFTTTQQFPANRIGGSEKVLIVKANGGSVALSYKFGEEYITEEVFSVDSVKRFSTQCDFQLTVTGGASYAIE